MLNLKGPAFITKIILMCAAQESEGLEIRHAGSFYAPAVLMVNYPLPETNNDVRERAEQRQFSKEHARTNPDHTARAERQDPHTHRPPESHPIQHERGLLDPSAQLFQSWRTRSEPAQLHAVIEALRNRKPGT